MKTTIFVLLFSFVLILPGQALAQQATRTPTPTRTPVATRTPTPKAAPDEVTKSYCASAFGYATLAALKADALIQAKRLAINELFGELITASTAVENFAVTSDQIRALSAGFVRVRQDEYSHGPNLGDVCVTITAYATADDRAKFVPVPIERRNCVTDATMSVGQLRQHAQEEVLVQALLEYDRRLADTERETLLRLLRRVVYSESGFAPGTESYCVTAQGEVTPVEVLALLEGMDFVVAVGTPVATAPGRTATPRPTATPRGGATLTIPQQTATAFAATREAFVNRTPTFTPTFTPTPDHTATAVTLMVDVMATAQAAPHQIYDLWVNPVDDAVYVYVPEGEFTMGSRDGGANELPVHKVHLDAFWIMRTEVTNAQYARCVRAGICTAPQGDNGRWKDDRYTEHPVTSVDWNQAKTYAKWIHGNLPTEAEWEKSCRGGDLRVYPWGTARPSAQLLNFDESGIRGTSVVSNYPFGASPYGALNMAGNVWEFVADWYNEKYDDQTLARNPTGPDNGSARGLRGGSSYDNGSIVRCTTRYSYSPGDRDGIVGFRVVVPLGD